MTARSFTEALARNDDHVDEIIRDFADGLANRDPFDEIRDLIAEVRDLRAQRDSSRSIAAALEGEAAQLQAIVDRLEDELEFSPCYADHPPHAPHLVRIPIIPGRPLLFVCPGVPA